MTIELDMTKRFNVSVDYTGVSDLRTFIDIGLTDSLSENLSFSLRHFILNLDVNIIKEIQDREPSLSFLKEDGFFIIKNALFNFIGIKGGDIELYDYMLRNDRKTYYKTWDYKLCNDDRIYEVGGTLMLFHEIKIFMYLVTNNPVLMKFDLDDVIYIDSYDEFIRKVKELNDEMRKLIQNNKPGLFFDSAFREKNILSNLDSDELIIKITKE